MNNVNQQFLVSTLVIALGYALRRTGILNEKDGTVLAKTLFNVTLPAVVISTFSTFHVDPSLLVLPAIHMVYGVLLGGLALAVYARKSRERRGLMTMITPAFNIGLFAYPLVENILGRQALLYLGMIDMGNAMVGFVFCYLIGFWFSPHHNGVDAKKMLHRLVRSVPLMAYLLTLAVCMAGAVGVHYPAMVVQAAKVLAEANMPLALLVLGIFLNFKFHPEHWADVGRLLAMRYLLGVAVGLAMYHWLPFNHLMLVVLLVSMLLPPALMMIPFGVEFGYDVRFIGTAANLGNIISYALVYCTFLATAKWAG